MRLLATESKVGTPPQATEGPFARRILADSPIRMPRGLSQLSDDLRSSSSSPTRPSSLVERLSLLSTPSKAGKHVETIWSPFRIAYHATGYAWEWLGEVNPWPLFFLSLLALFGWCLGWLEGPHQAAVGLVQKEVLRYGRWFILGILSSVGIGSGAHTFLLFLGPHLARLAVKGQIERGLGETVAWGLGTAVGEVPPFLVARASALTRHAAGGRHRPSRPLSSQATLLDCLQHAMQRMIKATGFLGILLAASIPNPLFDLTGIACGYFLVPVRQFLLACLLGKTGKALLQAYFVHWLFSPQSRAMPAALAPMAPWLAEWRHRLQAKSVSGEEGFNLYTLWHSVGLLMVAYFGFRLLQSMAMIQAHKQRQL